MEFNKVVRGANRAVQDEEVLHQILDAGFLCHVSFVHDGQAHVIPTSYGRKGNDLYLHGSSKNFMLNQALTSGQICLSVTHLDGLVLARTLFDTSANYRSAVVYGSPELLSGDEKLEGLRIITEHIVKGRWDEVPLGTEPELKATMVIKVPMSSVSVKVRAGAPAGDEDKVNFTWSGHIPLVLKALEPVADPKFDEQAEWTPSVKAFVNKYV